MSDTLSFIKSLLSDLHQKGEVLLCVFINPFVQSDFVEVYKLLAQLILTLLYNNNNNGLPLYSAFRDPQLLKRIKKRCKLERCS